MDLSEHEKRIIEEERRREEIRNENKSFEPRDDFIGVFDGYLTDENIQEFMDGFHYAQQNGWTMQRHEYDTPSVIEKKDESMNLGDNRLIDKKDEGDTVARIHQVTHKGFLDYMNDVIIPEYQQAYPILKEAHMKIWQGKMQKTVKGGGYHIWHCEALSKVSRDRALAWMVYLNDVEEGGETEFLYQKTRFKPKKGQILVWPSQFTHMHRGNPPLSNDKYILTGWVEYIDDF